MTSVDGFGLASLLYVTVLSTPFIVMSYSTLLRSVHKIPVVERFTGDALLPIVILGLPVPTGAAGIYVLNDVTDDGSAVVDLSFVGNVDMTAAASLADRVITLPPFCASIIPFAVSECVANSVVTACLDVASVIDCIAVVSEVITEFDIAVLVDSNELVRDVMELTYDVTLVDVGMEGIAVMDFTGMLVVTFGRPGPKKAMTAPCDKQPLAAILELQLFALAGI